MTHRDIALELVQALGYAEDERVRATWLIGSSASGDVDAYSDVDVMIAVSELIDDEERLSRLKSAGCSSIMLCIAGVDNPALPVQSQVIDKFVFRDVWFDVSYHLPHQLEFYFDCLMLIDRDNMSPELQAPERTYTDAELKARVQADLRLLHARIYRYEKYIHRKEWIGLDLAAIKNLIVDVIMVLNDRPNYNRYSSKVTQKLRVLPTKPDGFEEAMLDVLHLDNRVASKLKIDLLNRLERDLIALCQARWGPIAMFDDGDDRE